MPKPYKGFLNRFGHQNDKPESSRRAGGDQQRQPIDPVAEASTTPTPISTAGMSTAEASSESTATGSSPQSIPNPSSSTRYPGADYEDAYTPIIGDTGNTNTSIQRRQPPQVRPWGNVGSSTSPTAIPSVPPPDTLQTRSWENVTSIPVQPQPVQTRPWEYVAPSNASMSSGKPSTISTSSVFSRNAPSASSFGTFSSYGSGAGSSSGGWKGIGGGTALEGSIPEEGSEQQLSSSVQSESGRLMKVVAPQEMSSLIDDTTSMRSRNPLPSSSPHPPRMPVVPTRSLLPDVSQGGLSPSATSELSYWPERSSVSSSSSSRQRPRRQLGAKDELKELADDLNRIVEQTVSKTLDIPRAAVSVNQMLRNSVLSPLLDQLSEGEITLHSEPSLTGIIKATLHFTDNLLNNPQSQQSQQSIKMLMLRALYNLGVKLKIITPTLGTVPHPQNYAVGSIPELPGQQSMESLIVAVASSETNNISEQDGAFIAPVLRGLSPEFSVLTLAFGFPKPEQEHLDNTSSLYEISRDIHFYCQKNFIRLCSSSGGVMTGSLGQPMPTTPVAQFVPPYRVPLDYKSPPISVSIATERATNLSGTLGGYVYPKIDPSDPNLAEYARSTFAITCAHVCLSELPGSSYPMVSVPSPVLVNIYKNALVRERNKYSPQSLEFQEYAKAISQLDEQFPSISLSSQSSLSNREPFGQVVWGERTVVDGSISDIAIIKCSPGMECRNFLGNDISFTEYDPALMFGNLHVKRIVRKMHPGMNVFKYGSTSKYTTGKINGRRLVYWADGKLQSSEFVVCSGSPVFASGGDSGAWVLQKSEDMQEEDAGTVLDDGTFSVSDRGSTLTSRSTGGPCLGVVGMLHSYDGERKEFGLFTPIESILERLHQVTHIKWGVVGVSDGDTEDPLIGGSESSDSGDEVEGGSDAEPASSKES